jgi:hypothetical protein
MLLLGVEAPLVRTNHRPIPSVAVMEEVRVFRLAKAELPAILGLSRSANRCTNPTIG